MPGVPLTTSDTVAGITSIYYAVMDKPNPLAVATLPTGWNLLSKNSIVDLSKAAKFTADSSYYKPESRGMNTPRNIYRTKEDAMFEGAIFDMTAETYATLQHITLPTQVDAATGVPGYFLVNGLKGVPVKPIALLIQQPSGYDPTNGTIYTRLYIPRAVNTAPLSWDMDKEAAAEQAFKFEAYFSPVAVAANSGNPLAGLYQILFCNEVPL